MEKLKIILLLFFTISMPVMLSGETTVTTSGAAVDGIPIDGINDIKAKIDDTMGTMGPGIADGFALANIGGYPIGTASLESFPHFFAGVSVSAGLTNMEYWDERKEGAHDHKPSGGISPAAYFGLGLGKGFDIMGKLLTFSNSLKEVPVDFDKFSVSKLNLVTSGVKIRYRLVDKITLLPLLFGFGGVTISAGADYLYANVGVEGTYEYPLEAIEISKPTPHEANIDFTPEYSIEEKVKIISGSIQALGYVDFLFIMGMYSGFGLSVNYGKFKQKISAGGTMSTDDADYVAANGSGDLGAVALASSETYKPTIIMPVYIIGFDLNLILVRMTLESMVNLRNGSDVNIQLGVRIQI